MNYQWVLSRDGKLVLVASAISTNARWHVGPHFNPHTVAVYQG